MHHFELIHFKALIFKAWTLVSGSGGQLREDLMATVLSQHEARLELAVSEADTLASTDYTAIDLSRWYIDSTLSPSNTELVIT